MVKVGGSGALLAVLACFACVSHREHLPPQELLKANTEAMQEAVPAKVSDPTRARQVSHAIDELREQLLSFDAKELEKVVPDKETRRPIAQTVKRIEDESKRLDSERKKLEKDVLAALKRHDTPPAQFHAFEERADAINTNSARNLLDLRFALRSQVSEAQWHLLFPSYPVPAKQ
jgi:septal ring factor EnvC (AmiA/AmiB activator)